jgi:1-acyl-sn-glycerol-3-phosphate acyltransferase
MIQFVKWAVRWALRYYYESIYLIDSHKWPQNAPVIIAGSHSNSAMDSFVLGSLAGNRSIWWLARGDAFNNKWVAKILNFLEMAPIYRSTEFGSVTSAKKNKETFDFSFGILQKNQTIGMFPEGITVHSRQLQKPFKKGLANMAFQAHQLLGKAIYVQPVGISYNHLAETRGTVYVKFGDPISTEKYFKAFKTNETETIKAFNLELEAAIEKEYLAIDSPNSQLNDALINKINANHKIDNVRDYGLSHSAEQYNVVQKAIKEGTQPLLIKASGILMSYFWVCYSVLQLLWLIPNSLVKLLIPKVAKKYEFYATVRFVLSLFIYPIYVVLSSFLLTLLLPFAFWQIAIGQMILCYWGLLCKSLHKNYSVALAK